MIPATLDGWSVDIVRDLLSKGYYESDRFDFKEKLPRDDAGRLRLAKTSCAFANSEGGFIVFGVSADARQPINDRIGGMEASLDFPVHFGPYPARCVPSVEWAFKNPAGSLSNGRLLQVVHVPPSWKRPHAVLDEASGWFFAKRTNQGNEAMNMEEIRAAFLGFYEKRVKLQLLRTELETLQRQAGQMIIADNDLETSSSLTSFDLSVIESVLGDTYTLLATNRPLLVYLAEIRQHCRSVNKWVNLLVPVWNLAMTNKGPMIRDHNTRVNADAKNIVRLAAEAIRLLDEVTK